MKILLLNYEFPPLGGGASPVSAQIAKGYVDLGHEVSVVTMSFRGLERKEVVDGILVYRVKCFRRKKEICYLWELISYLISARRFLKKHLGIHNYDVCHCHFLVPTGILARWVKQKFNIPFIVTAHGSDVPGYNPDRFIFFHYFTRPILRRVIEEASQIVSPSNFLLNLIHAKINLPAAKGLVIQNGISISERSSTLHKKPIILSTGRLLERKGFQYLIQAVSELDIDYEVHICGDGPMMTRLQDLAAHSTMPIIFHGWMDNTSVQFRQLLEDASIYVLASKKENASIAILEAMEASCAVITANDSGCQEMIGEGGLTVPPGDVEALREALVDLLEQPEKQQAFGNLARKRVEEHFDWVHIVDQYVEILEKRKINAPVN